MFSGDKRPHIASERLLSKCRCPLKSPATLPRSQWDTFTGERLWATSLSGLLLCSRVTAAGTFYSTIIPRSFPSWFCYSSSKGILQVEENVQSDESAVFPEALTRLMEVVQTHLWFVQSSPQTESPQSRRRAPPDWPRWSGTTPVCSHVSVGQDILIFTCCKEELCCTVELILTQESAMNTIKYTYYINYIQPTLLWVLLGTWIPLFCHIYLGICIF